MKKNDEDKILRELELGYDFMAKKFSETRKYFWRDLEFIKDYAKDGDAILDFGCGNGRLLELLADKKIIYFGTDISEKLVDMARDRYLEHEKVNFSKIEPGQTSLAFNSDFFNAVYSIAVFHHFPGKKYRKTMAEELYRITKPGGYVIITVWNLWQKKYIKSIVKNWIEKILFKSSLDFGDCHVTFKDNQGNVFKRYHHAFTSRELERLFEKAGFKKGRTISGKNLVFVGRK